MQNLTSSLIFIFVAAIFQSYALVSFSPYVASRWHVSTLNILMLSVNALLFVIYRLVLYPTFLTPFRHLPSPGMGHFIVGHGDTRTELNKGERMRKWIDEVPNDGLIYVRDVFGADAVLPTTPQLLKTILVDNTYDYQKDQKIQSILRRVLGDGLVLVEGGVHKFQRKHLLPSFQLKTIRNLYPMFWEKGVELIKQLHFDVQKGKEIEMSSWTTRATLDIIGVAAFGKDFGTLENPDNELVDQYHAILEPTGGIKIWFGLHFIFPGSIIQAIPFWKVPKFVSAVSKSLNTYAINMVRERRAALADPKLSASEKEDMKDILSQLVLSNDFNDKELADQALTMLAAGHETTSASLSWTIFLLATHPEIQTRLREEVRATLPSPEQGTAKSIDAATLDAMPLLNGVCNETTRLYPTVPFDARTVVAPTKLGGYEMPVGTVVFIPPWAFNRSEKLWGADASAFKPERWINENGTPNNSGGATSNYMLMTFLHGPRSCIGQGFARSELKCLLATLVGRYEFSLSRDKSTYIPAGLVTTKPMDGMWANVKEIPGW